MQQIYLGIGANVGDRHANITQALDLLTEKVKYLVMSKILETEPWGVTDQPNFLNLCVGGQTELTPKELLKFVKDIEQKVGRIKRQKWGPREIDIDILLYGNQVIDQPGLTIPHAHMHERSFVLDPLAEIAPDALHPKLNNTVAELQQALK